MSRCSECNSELKPGNKFCTNCGAKIAVQPAAAAQCPNCGNNLKTGAKFCAKCGNAVSTASAPAPAPAPAPTAEEETAKKRFLIRVTGRGGEYAAVKATPDEIGALVNAYQNDYLDFVDMVDASSNESHHTTGVFAEDYELTVTDLETDEEVDLSEWDDDYHCREALIGLDDEEFCVCCFDVQEGTFFEFEVEDDEFNVDKLRTKQIETRFGDIIVAFEYSDEPTDNFDFDAEGYETSSEETQFAIFDAEDQEVPIEAWLEDDSVEEEVEEEAEEEAEEDVADESGLNIAAMLDILMTIHDSKVFYGRNLDSKKVNNALGEYVSDKIEPEDVLVQVDDTVFGNAKDGCIITLNKIYVKDVNDTRSAVITPNTVWGLKKGLFSKSILMDGEVIFTYTQPETAAMEKLVKALNALCGK